MPTFRELIQAALEINDPIERGKMLDSACRGDGELRARVERFLASEGQAEEFFSECTEAVNCSRKEANSPAGSEAELAPTVYSIGDLDWIVMKTLEKDRARRYETATRLPTGRRGCD
jgi:hypothetical protein